GPGGGPRERCCPDDACWRVRSRVVHFPEDRAGEFETAGRPWMLEPEEDSLVELMTEAAADLQGRRSRGEAGARAARELSWEAVGELYAERLRELASKPARLATPPHEPLELEED